MAAGAFVLPEGVKLSLDESGLSVTATGDIVIEGAPGQALNTLVSSGGSVTVSAGTPVEVGSITADAGTVRLSGKVQVGRVSADRIEFDSGTLKADVLKASTSISLAGRKLEAQVVAAPTVEIGTKLKGRATAIHSDGDLGAHKLKGGFSLSEFVSLMPHAAELLASAGISVPEEDDEDEDEDEEDEDEEDEDEEDEDEDEDDDADEDADEDDDADESADGSPADLSASDIEDALSDEDLEQFAAAMEELADDGIDPAVKEEIRTALAGVVNAYAGGELPPPVELVSNMVEQGSYADLKLQINTIWAEVIKFHAINKDRRMPNSLGPLFEGMQKALRKIA